MYIGCKRFLDIIMSIVILIILAPIMAIIVLVIKLDSGGPVLFKQQRLGKYGKDFTILKFRTMVLNAERMRDGLNSFENDSRVTKIGKFLRNSSLDELPQLFNILKGDMSFIGPRPPVTYHPYKYEDYPPQSKRRFEVTPGITGYAQINGRNELSWEEKFKYDLYYIENKSFQLDLKIFIFTFFKVLKMEGSFDIEQNKNVGNLDERRVNNE